MADVVTKRVLCLANSRRPGGRCVAGREVLPDGRLGAWIRPISPGDEEGLSAFVRRYRDRSEPQLLDVITMPLGEHRPMSHQQENWLPAAGLSWARDGRWAPEDLDPYLLTDGPLWANGNSSSRRLNDQVTPLELSKFNYSLCLIKVDDLQFRVSQPHPEQEGTERLDGVFTFAGDDYALRVTDPEMERRFLSQGVEDLLIGDAYLTISVGMPYGVPPSQYAYKFIAAVIIP